MGTNLKFNSAICTSREQSDRLLALGLKKETADCVIMYYDGWHIGEAEHFDFDKDPVEPAWSLHRLIEMIPSKLNNRKFGCNDNSCYYMELSVVKRILSKLLGEDALKYALENLV